jgi:hypothetical protein
MPNFEMQFSLLYRRSGTCKGIQKVAVVFMQHHQICMLKYLQCYLMSGRPKNDHVYDQRDSESDFGEKGKLGARDVVRA